MAKKITKLVIKEVSLVDRPANQHARILLMKRADTQTKDTNMANVDLQKLAMLGLDVLAHNLRKREPHLTEAQAFAKVCSENPDVLRAERAGAYAKMSVAQTQPVVGETDGYDELVRMAADFRRQNPTLTPEQSFSRRPGESRFAGEGAGAGASQHGARLSLRG